MGFFIVNELSVISFWLVFTRVLTTLIQIPLFELPIPSRLKVLATFVISYAIFPLVESSVITDINYLGQEYLGILTSYYILTGLVIGFLIKSILNIFIASGSMITQQIGFGAIRYFDPSSASQIGPFENLLKWTMLVMILGSGALLPMLKGLLLSFSKINYVSTYNAWINPEFFIHIFKDIFFAALLLSSPLIFINLLIMGVLGVVSRTVPQMNVLMVSFVINIGLGLIVFSSISEEFFQVGFDLYTKTLAKVYQVII